MKKSAKKLSLNKMTIANLNSLEMGRNFGGLNSADNTTASLPLICTIKNWTMDNKKAGCHSIVCPNPDPYSFVCKARI
jgi:hypothetical protein